MRTDDTAPMLVRLFGELIDGATAGGFVLNTGDIGLLRSLDTLSAADASRSTNEGATIAAHVQHVALHAQRVTGPHRREPFQVFEPG